MRNPFVLPWFLWDLDNLQLITSSSVPEGEIKDTKAVIFAETPIPGRNYQPVSASGNGNRKVSFTLPIVHRNPVLGNLLMVKQFDALRNQSRGFLGGAVSKPRYSRNPKVLYYWGVGSVPLVYYVTKCDFRHTALMVGAIGQPQVSYVDIELTLDEENELYRAEEMFRDYAVIAGEMASAALLASQRFGIGNPF